MNQRHPRHARQGGQARDSGERARTPGGQARGGPVIVPRGLVTIEGVNPVREALRAGRELRQILVRDAREQALAELLTLARQRGVPVEARQAEELDDLAEGRMHQGIVALAAPRPAQDIDDCLALAASRGQPPLLVALDGVEDPQNVGSIIRSAEACGAHGVIVPERRTAPIGPTVGRASAGAVEHLPVAEVVNLVRALKELKERGAWIVGTHQDAPQIPWQADLAGPVCIVIGSEGRGMGRLVTETCDFLVRIPMQGKVDSLNAAATASMLLYEALRQRQSS